jgi:hypothetical protein
MAPSENVVASRPQTASSVMKNLMSPSEVGVPTWQGTNFKQKKVGESIGSADWKLAQQVVN